MRTVDETLRTQWDDYVGHQEHGNLLQSWGWGELRAHYGWKTIRLAASRPGGQGWAGVIQVLQQRVGPLGWGYAPQGPVLGDLSDVFACRALLRQAASQLRRNRIMQLKCDPEWPALSAQADQLIEGCGLRPARFDIQHRQTWLLDISGGLEAAQARIPATTRYSVRVARRRGVVVTREEGEDAVGVFHDLHMQTVGRKHFHSRPLSYYQLAAQALGASIFIARLEGQPLAAGFTVALGDRLVHVFGGTSTAAPAARASYALQWAMIGWGIAQGCTLYDMWGVPRNFDPANPEHGYATFKTNWGGRLASYRGLMIAPVLGSPLDGVLHAGEAILLRNRPLLR